MYLEGEFPVITNGNCNNGNGGMWGNDGIWAILLLALLGFGGRGFGGGFGGFGGYGGAGSEFVGYQLGKGATQADIASGFNNSAVLSSLNDIKLTQASNLNFINQGFAGLNNVITTGNAGIQQTLCQGFNGINTAILQSANATERGFAQAGYNLANCCCELKGAIADVKYANEAQTCQIINAINAGNQRLVDIYTNDKIDTLNRKLAVAENKALTYENNAYLINQIKPCPIPAYVTCNPNTGLTYPQGLTNVNFGGNGCCGCGNGF